MKIKHLFHHLGFKIKHSPLWLLLFGMWAVMLPAMTHPLVLIPMFILGIIWAFYLQGLIDFALDNKPQEVPKYLIQDPPDEGFD